MVIVKIDGENNFHPFEFQSHRDKCWLQGYIEVPNKFERVLIESNGFCDLVIEDGVLTNIIPRPDCKPDTPLNSLTREDEIEALLVEQDYRLTLIELGVNE